jgi:hypothetical protein
MAENALLTIPTPRLDESLAFCAGVLRKRRDRPSGGAAVAFVTGAL